MIPLVQKPKTPGTNSLFFLNHDGQVLGDNSNSLMSQPKDSIICAEFKVKQAKITYSF